ncbi:hypothetical protein [Neosynechococcus sphagnicola]|uniref:O-linked N-acetylglucosamine transferase, SPINDLY family protein n=1 Tax=Neosynechococcus sphagnicola TaxID=1501145 RepID=UPI000689B40D|nr:hypothetical protein [Neosynechococcus sphagnicola]
MLMCSGYWQEALKVGQEQAALALTLETDPPTVLTASEAGNLLLSLFMLPYLQDAPQQFHRCQQPISRFFQTTLQRLYAAAVEQYQQQHQQRGQQWALGRPLRIGYLSHCLRRHSVGFLVRSLLHHHDRAQFHIYGYMVNYQESSQDPVQQWFKQNIEQVRLLGTDTLEIAEQIHQDQIDVLVDLDSLTLELTLAVMALKPAPVQVTWLGYDAAGLPAIDYFIADPYVLPESAQDYYQEKIWRLPQTYIAVDGFEVDLPTLDRADLAISDSAMVYLTAQVGKKRHPDTIRLQLQILQGVPGSYLLIKGLGDQGLLKTSFLELADQAGVDRDRLRFLPLQTLEAQHRANLAIADVVLDTYPYTGATTTLEALWMGIPLVTRVGEQFAARNSYTMLRNVGVDAGIAHSDSDYVAWGIRLGTDARLRDQVTLQLLQARRSAPLWNAPQFAREMETAYQQMWQRYVQTIVPLPDFHGTKNL